MCKTGQAESTESTATKWSASLQTGKRITYSQDVSPEVSRYENGAESGKYILFENNQKIAQIRRVYANGKISYTYNYQSQVTASYSPQVDRLANGTTRGNRIVVGPAQSGTRRIPGIFSITYAFANGYVSYSQNNRPQATHVFTRTVERHSNGAREGVRMVDSDNTIDVIRYALEDGRAVVNRNYQWYASASFSLETSRHGDIERGKRVIDAQNRVGTVNRVFADGRTQYTANYTARISRSLSAQVDQLTGGFERGKRVIDTDNHVGTISYAFADGRIQYTSNYNARVSRTLSPETTRRDDGLERGQTVIDAADRVGQVNYVFANQKVGYTTNYTLRIATDLWPEVDTHPTYNKQDYYSTDNRLVGLAYRFFSNGKIQFSSAHVRRVVSQLIESVVSHGGITTGETLFLSSSELGIARYVFPNGAIAFDVADPNQQDISVILGGQMFDAARMGDDGLRLWIEALEAAVTTEIQWDERRLRQPDLGQPIFAQYIRGGSLFGVTSANYPAVQRLLLEYLTNHPDLIRNSMVRSRVLDKLEIVNPWAAIGR